MAKRGPAARGTPATRYRPWPSPGRWPVCAHPFRPAERLPTNRRLGGPSPRHRRAGAPAGCGAQPRQGARGGAPRRGPAAQPPGGGTQPSGCVGRNPRQGAGPSPAGAQGRSPGRERGAPPGRARGGAPIGPRGATPAGVRRNPRQGHRGTAPGGTAPAAARPEPGGGGSRNRGAEGGAPSQAIAKSPSRGAKPEVRRSGGRGPRRGPRAERRPEAQGRSPRVRGGTARGAWATAPAEGRGCAPGRT